jgi:hypothetical protein
VIYKNVRGGELAPFQKWKLSACEIFPASQLPPRQTLLARVQVQADNITASHMLPSL